MSVASGMLGTGLNGLETYIADASRRVADGEGDDVDELATRLAHLLTKVAQVVGELRKVDAEERRRGEVVTADAVFTWFRSLPRGERAGVVSELEQITQTRSGLA
jgi:hypothetical protein